MSFWKKGVTRRNWVSWRGGSCTFSYLIYTLKERLLSFSLGEPELAPHWWLQRQLCLCIYAPYLLPYITICGDKMAAVHERFEFSHKKLQMVSWMSDANSPCPSMIYYIWVASRNHRLAHIADYHVVMVWVTTDLLLTCSKFDLIRVSFAKKMAVECMHPIRHFICTRSIENSIQNGGFPLILHWKCCFCCRLRKYQLCNHGWLNLLSGSN